MVGYETALEFPNSVHSWSDPLHPDDVAPTFAAFAKHLEDRSGRMRYRINYRLKMRDGSYHWFRATGGCIHGADGITRACGSLTDIHDQMVTEQRIQFESDEDHKAIIAIGNGLKAIAEGDLVHRITGEITPKAQSMKDDFNATMDALQETLIAVTTSISGLRSGTSEISQGADDLSRRTEQQAASLEETAASLDEITATVRRSAEGAKHAAGTADSVRVQAEASGAIVDQATSAMTQIEESSQEISQIIGVIDDIAFQTNLLALNAGVEAARAGEAGKGFAVVAQEVRELAQRSANTAKEIKTLITLSSQQVNQGVQLVDKTGDALKAIVGRIGEINGLVGEIASSTQEQSVGLHQINTAVNQMDQMDQMTQQNAAMVEETSASSRALAGEASELERLVKRFKLESDFSYQQNRSF
jgi:methyl-accepting chemotaxis protein